MLNELLILILHPLKNILNNIIWGIEDSKDYEIIYVNRSKEKNESSIRGDKISKVGKSWFKIYEETETVIPFHRIIFVRNLKTNKTIWKKELI